MQESIVTVINKLGLHARAAAKLVTEASRFRSTVDIGKDGKLVNGKSIMGVMMLAASKGTELKIVTEGDDEQEAMDRIISLVNNRFGEDE